MATALVVLAAGKGTRMKSDLPKVLHEVAGAPMLVHALRAGAAIDPARTIVVTGHGAEAVAAAARAWDPAVELAHQDEQLGTGHAVDQCRAALADFEGDVIVLYGDTPFIQPETLAAMQAARATHDLVVLGFEAADAGRYGRLKMSGQSLEAIVEFKDADAQDRAITLCNSGVIAANAGRLFSLLEAVGNDNASGEYYLTDVVGLARARGLAATVVTCDEAETLGVDSRAALVRANAIYQDRARADLIEAGATLLAPETVHLSFDTLIGPDTVIEPNVVFGPNVTIENGASIRAFSHLEGCHVARGAVVGPYARLRPGAELAEDTRIGNFVEIKNAQIHAGAKVNHLSYIGDADLGENTNVGAGTVTCNYDGVFKHRTTVGRNVFLGSDTMLVAPVTLGDESMTASGTVVTQDVPEGALALGRARQVNKPGLARRMFEKLKAQKAKRDRDHE
ncbi:MAG: bifunctional UDP-N-acetylglucosamine diphosphorylase/glucosamine-1-phosphate N-acetyltransferase GlmU [Salibaculum sp.]|uniref:bifunctional UDP-N-acetylglucosamine diphosphorylase/glucosamine-1-phosphate N-acetyltransferase GlmU n=1 Tax=Salibaculum sp. TaxID=2855480 RepID=UPI0028702A0C|nr:bifunctional UDP-N-acetylglucosamine diphosphorylase/glucosamine-1-phosphate N-acetyltransferase GlmU [Salibaculum sp.]MDR9426920.1 bifunctional UDP-N-acetylglucosamine diphosphorylase/glucosamine-1-phosphate N-acetyltransferase GlmU [Salibaculum sp.]MDR9483170.1 bifunctional UDP-N-acetylglucosamine diphosphorylase/glucosamine-1-phosphate N-acetyltransferase GlmU [Salibaculum sp.]